MATHSLDDNKIDAGIKLLKELDKNPSLDIVSALWYYYTDLEHWEFLIYTPEFYKRLKDLKDFYRIVDDCIAKNPEVSKYINLSDIRLISETGHNIIGLLQNIVQTDIKSYGCTRMTSNHFNGFYIEDILLYRNAI